MQKLEKNKIYGSAQFITDLLPETERRECFPPRPGAAAPPRALYSRMHAAVPVKRWAWPLSAPVTGFVLAFLCQRRFEFL